MTRRRLAALALLLLAPIAARAATVADSSGRLVTVPDRVECVLPASQAAAVLLQAVAPDLMLGWPQPPSGPARAWLADRSASLPTVPDLSAPGRVATEPVRALRPDLIVQYGPIATPDADRVRAIEAQTGVPTLLLDGALRQTPHALRLLGTALGRADRAEPLARLAEAMLVIGAPVGSDTRVAYVRGADDGLALAAPGSDAAALFAALGWTVPPLPGAPAGGAQRPATIADIARLDPDVLVFEDQAMRDAVRRTPDWRQVRAVAERHAFVAPALPFGWVGPPASLNRLLGLAWLSGADPVTAAALFDAVAYGRAPTTAQLAALRTALRPLNP